MDNMQQAQHSVLYYSPLLTDWAAIKPGASNLIFRLLT